MMNTLLNEQPLTHEFFLVSVAYVDEAVLYIYKTDTQQRGG